MIKTLTILAATMFVSAAAFANDMKPVSFTSSPALGMQANGREVEQSLNMERPYALTGMEIRDREISATRSFTAANSPHFRANNSR